MRCTEDAEEVTRNVDQTIDYKIGDIDKYIGYERSGYKFVSDAYGLAIFQNPEYNIGAFTVTNFLYLFDTATSEVHSYIEIPVYKNRQKSKHSSTNNEILYCCEFAIVDEQLFVIAGGEYGCIYCINLQSEEIVKILGRHGGPIHCLKSNPKYPFIIASCGKDRTVKIWDLRSESDDCDYITFAGLGGHRMQINSLSWHSSGTKIASAGYDLRICLWDIPEDHLELWRSAEIFDFSKLFPLLIQYPEFSTMMLHTSAIDCVLWLDTMLISKAADGELICWTPAEDEESKTFHLDVERLQPVNVLLRMTFDTEIRWFVQFAYCRANKHLVTGNTEGTIYFWNLQDLVDKRNEIITNPVVFESDNVFKMKEVYNENRKLISFEPAAGYNYNYKHLNCCLRNFAFSVDGMYCYALTERGNIVRFKNNKI